MNMVFKVWILAILYQTIIFAFIPVGLPLGFLIAFVPAEMIGGLPGLLIFAAVMYHLRIQRHTLKRKWTIATGGAAFAAIVTALLSILFVGAAAGMDSLEPDLKGCLLLLPAPLSAILALVTLTSAIKQYFNQAPVSETL